MMRRQKCWRRRNAALIPFGFFPSGDLISSNPMPETLACCTEVATLPPRAKQTRVNATRVSSLFGLSAPILWGVVGGGPSRSCHSPSRSALPSGHPPVQHPTSQCGKLQQSTTTRGLQKFRLISRYNQRRIFFRPSLWFSDFFVVGIPISYDSRIPNGVQTRDLRSEGGRRQGRTGTRVGCTEMGY
jgi:hypothetical protein